MLSLIVVMKLKVLCSRQRFAPLDIKICWVTFSIRKDKLCVDGGEITWLLFREKELDFYLTKKLQMEYGSKFLNTHSEKSTRRKHKFLFIHVLCVC